MLRFRISKGVISLSLDVRAIAPILRGALVLLIDAWSWGMHPASPFQPILLRNRIVVPL